MMFIPYTMINSYYWLFFWLLFSPHFYVIAIEKIATEQKSLWTNFTEAFRLAFNNWLKFIPFYLIGLFGLWVVALLQSSMITGLVTNFISWHQLFDVSSKNTAFVNMIISWTLFLIFSPVAYYFFKNQYYSTITQAGALDMKAQLRSFGKTNSVFE